MTAGVGPAVTDVRPVVWWDAARWVLLGAWVVVTVVGVATMAHWSTYAALRADLDHGLDRVTVAGPGAPPSGDVVQEVRWRSGGVNRKVLVNVVAPADPSTDNEDFPGAGFTTDDGFSTDGLTQVPGRDVGAVLKAAHPGLAVNRTGFDETAARAGESGGIKLGLHIETPFGGQAGAADAMILLLAVVLIAFGPPPWRATRWAWFWLLGVPWLGLPAMLVLSGPTRWVPPPRSAGRLTGGKALLLAMVTYTLASLFGLT